MRIKFKRFHCISPTNLALSFVEPAPWLIFRPLLLSASTIFGFRLVRRTLNCTRASFLNPLYRTSTPASHVFHPGFQLQGDRLLLPLQQSMVEGNTRATRYLRARRNGVYFRAVERDHFKRQHSGIKAPHSFSGTMLFGQIQAFWLHPLCRHPDSSIQVFVEAVWATPLPPDDVTGILRCTTRARSAEEANMLASPFRLLASCPPCNVVLLSQDVDDEVFLVFELSKT